MIYFGDAETRAVYMTGVARKIPDFVAEKAARQLDILAAATRLEEARFAGHGRIAKVRGSKPPRYLLHVTGMWWMGFQWLRHDALDVRLEKRQKAKKRKQ